MTVEIEYEAEIEMPLSIEYHSFIQNVIEAALDYENCPYEVEVNVLLTDNAAIQAINLEQRQIDRPTDVLSFPMQEYPTPSDLSLIHI